MKVLKNRKEVLDIINHYSYKIGLVPTMGAIHKGHISLISQSIAKNHLTICSVFVNRTQFNNVKDFETYPRHLAHDLEEISATGCNIVFTPNEDEMFSQYETLNWKLGHLEQTMEGKFRKNHFQGVANVVFNLFKLFQPDRAYFGEKDFQQLCVIKKMVEIKKLNTEIISCPTQRNYQGLALSSRNEKLSEEGKQIAAHLYKALRLTRYLISKGNSLAQSKNLVSQRFFAPPQNNKIQLEYFEFATEDELIPIDAIYPGKKIRAFIAAHVENVRLIDNLRVI